MNLCLNAHLKSSPEWPKLRRWPSENNQRFNSEITLVFDSCFRHLYWCLKSSPWHFLFFSNPCSQLQEAVRWRETRFSHWRTTRCRSWCRQHLDPRGSQFLRQAQVHLVFCQKQSGEWVWYCAKLLHSGNTDTSELLTQASLDPGLPWAFYSLWPWQELPVMDRKHEERQRLSNLAQQSKIRWKLGLTTWTIFRYRAYRESFATVITFSAILSACWGSAADCAGCNKNLMGGNFLPKV